MEFSLPKCYNRVAASHSEMYGVDSSMNHQITTQLIALMCSRKDRIKCSYVGLV